jgi:hypothetical protein
MTHLTYKQLAFLLDITDLEAYEKFLAIDSSVTGKPTPSPCNTITRYRDQGYKAPELSIDILSKKLNLPNIQDALIDISENYLKRPAAKKYILCDYPEKKLETLEKHKVKIPSVLASLLKPETVAIIRKEWEKRFGIPV